MGLSRRIFTKEFKLAAVQRLERGSSIGEVARALEANPNVLHRWRREIRQGPGNVFPGHGKQRWADGRRREPRAIKFLLSVVNAFFLDFPERSPIGVLPFRSAVG